MPDETLLNDGPAEDQRRQSHAFLDNVFEAIQDGLSILDTELNIVRVNQTMRDWYEHAQALQTKVRAVLDS